MPNTIAQNLARLIEAKTDIADAITAKGGTVGANDGFEEFPADIATIPSGGGSIGKSDVNFYDYDGTIVASYTASDFAELTAMPDNPTHEGLTAQGWNWSLSDAKGYVANYDKLEIGQMYVTSDGTTRAHINLIDNYTSPTLEFYLEANSEVDVDWGDGSTHSTFTSTTAGYVSELHSYSTSGDYNIIINVISGSIKPNGNGAPLLKGSDAETNRIYRESLYNIEIGNSVTSIGVNAFSNCRSLTSITIPNSVTSISSDVFSNCYSLLNIYVANASIPAGSPWGAPNSHVNVVATRHNNYQSSCTEVASVTTLTGTVNATVGDLVIATFVIRGNTYTIDSGWTLLGISEVVGTSNQRTAMAYKIATSSSESLTVTQDTAGRIYLNLVSITGASVGTFSGFTTQGTGSSITLPKPQGPVIWGVSSSLWGTNTPYQLWGISDKENVAAIQLPNTTQPRCLTALDQSNNASETFTYSPDISGDAALAAASLTITGIDNFWYYDNP
jgi:hypothetical protein